jgi:iron complex transport system substrate-binding protein
MSKTSNAGVRLLTLLTLALALGLTLTVSSAHAAAISITDDRGQTQQFTEAPRRIITLIPSLTETVCALGACERLVGVDRYSNFPASVDKLPKLGGLDDTQVETIVALRPDVVILAPSSRVQDRLSALGLKVVVLETRSHADVKRVLLTLGTLLAAPEPLKIWQRIETAVDQAAASVPAAAKGLSVYYEVDSAPYAAGESSFIGETLARLGAKNIVGKDLGPFPKLNPEFIVRADPQVIMIAQRSAVNLSNRPGWERVRALRDKRVCVFAPAESEVMGRPGPRMAEAAQSMARCLREVVGPGKP